ncbi:anaerobic ribonucleoside-triphosphate reductase activating protein [Candidatus Uhrbacteria bacterium]|nr:MAG: anaerobic ribonucleoside-triphosphate reductase activating protein [Candidatus Uhrbacteria bacterium]
MKFSGIQKLTLLDYPGKTACVAFTPGCNFRCGYCHNPEFVLPERIKELEPSFIPEEDVLAFLEERRGKLEGVVVTGGEPTLHRGLPAFLRRVRDLGFLVKLDTNGSLPEALEPILREGLADYVAMDIKTSPERYPELVGVFVRADALKRSIELIKTFAPDYEFRTTVVAEHHGLEEFRAIAHLIKGARRYVLQGFRPDITLDPAYQSYARVGANDLEAVKLRLKQSVEELIIRT